jgi:alpha-D-ribose 1-methylphosphonate 5-triphosphate synthase subunit PhnL
MKVIEKLQKIKADGVAMIGIFHDMQALRAISDKVYDLKEKKYVEI